ncbi:sodium/potassium/calcium exchanger 6, mitochondrial [Plakobranchus ocellatus]|uniref:Sodium/potassium/calcium exchanger 6, mitochondrial n=1 Tax=Plakobranchus ocellatus TaxID=259542 RepID=A0AAV4C6Y2_9GAST|nr:sodium/potassium/calcium exchanger 6, mitochondrial [Plakobranchus ocellatus]
MPGNVYNTRGPVAAIGNAKAGDAGLAIGALFGAGVFVTAVVAGSIAIICPFRCMERPLMRDVIFYLIATYFCWYILWDKKITQWEAAGLLLMYGVYVVVVILGRYINQKLKKRRGQLLIRAGEENGSRDPLLRAGDSSTSNNDSSHPTTYNSITANIIDEDVMSGLLASTSSGASDSGDYTLHGGSIDSISRGPNIQVEMHSASRFHRWKNAAVDSGPLWREFISGVNPINTEEWSDLGLHWKIYEVFKCPIVLCLKLTVPVVDDEDDEEEEEEVEEVEEEDITDGESQEKGKLILEKKKDPEDDLRNWNRPLNCVQIFLGIVFASLGTGVGTKTIGSTFPVYVLVIILAAALAIGIFLTTKTTRRPRFHTALAYLGFVVSVVWIYCIANEIVNILQVCISINLFSDFHKE